MRKFKKEHLEYLNTKKKNFTESLVNGAANNMQEYGYNCGYIRGIQDCLESFEEFWDQYVKSNEEEVDWNE